MAWGVGKDAPDNDATHLHYLNAHAHGPDTDLESIK